MNNLSGIQQSAIFLMALGEETAAEIFKHLTPKEIQQIGQEMSYLANIETKEISSVLNKFIQEVQNQTSIGMEKDKYIKNVLVKALGKDKAQGVLGNILSGTDSTGLDTLKWMDPRSIADIIRHEHPQIISIVLSYLDSEQAASVLSMLNDEMIQQDVIRRIASLESVQPMALEELNMVLERQFSEATTRSKSTLGGIKTAADIMNFLEGNLEETILKGLKEEDDELREKIEDQMFIFENLNDIDDRGMQTILREVSTDVLVLALKGASQSIKEKVFANMSKRASELLKDDLETKGPVRVSEVESAQKEILSVTRRLADAGEISLGGSSGEEYI